MEEKKPNGNRVITKSLVIFFFNHRSNVMAIRFHSFNKCLLIVYFALDVLLGARDETVSKTHVISCVAYKLIHQIVTQGAKGGAKIQDLQRKVVL